MRRVLKNKAFWVFAAMIVLAVGLSYSARRTRESTFCGNCHYMVPYIKQWRTSSHRMVECTRCHDYPLSRLLISSLKYATKTYNQRPRTEVKNSSCLQKGCHAEGLLTAKAAFRGGIAFDHSLHLNKPKRGMKLSCTSCHYQIVQGEHMAVTQRVCFLCHFKTAGKGESATGCPSCHAMPKRSVEHEGFAFSHESYLKLGVKCKQCHVEVTSGYGDVPEERCFSCHVERFEKMKDVPLIHETHISKHKVDCLMCHTPIEHGNVAMVGPLEVRCESCHLKLHDAEKEMYMGIDGQGVPDLPSRMFAAQVSCNGCHIHATESGEVLFGEKRVEAQREACVSCHGKGYDLMLDDWKRVMRKAQAECRAKLKDAEAIVRSSGVGGSQKVKASGLLEIAEFNCDFVRAGKGEHNVEHAIKLLRKSVLSADLAVKEVGGQTGASVSPILGLPDGYCLPLCHRRTSSPEKVSYKGKNLPHKFHIEEAGLGCGACHSVEKHKALDVKEKVCKDCH
ncbi:MAG: hypothetical protein QME66_09865 [Candidatus Eisenbacteria bacterium]|nr:hypothetical protein [Candidatus Eisenbacteria bacterium]